MSEFVYGSNTGLNNGVVTVVKSALGWAHVKVTLPDSVKAERWDHGAPQAGWGPYEAVLRNGLIAVLKDDMSGAVPVPRMFRFEFNVTITGAGIRFTRSFTTKKFEFDIKLPVGWNGQLQFSYSVNKYYGSWDTNFNLEDFPNSAVASLPINPSMWDQFWIFFEYTEFNYTPPMTDRILEVMGQEDAPLLRSIAIPDDATSLRLGTYNARGAEAKLLDAVQLEIPVSQWTPLMLNLCDQYVPSGFAEEQRICRYISRKGLSLTDGWVCRLRRIRCDGFKEPAECTQYSPLPKCAFLLARDLFTVDAEAGTIQVDDDQYKGIFSTKSGMGFVPSTAWRFSNEDLVSLQAGVYDAMDHIAHHYCHKFDNPADYPNALPCYASRHAAMPWSVVGQNTFWRYVKPNGDLDLTCNEAPYAEILLKTKDVPTSNPQNKWPSEAEILAGSVYYESKPDLSPTCVLPYSVPGGAYDLWLHCKNTTGMPVALSGAYPRKIKDLAEATSVAWAVPVSADYAWVKLTPIRPQAGAALQIGGGLMLQFGIDPSIGGAQIPGSAFDNGGEFAFTSLYIERV